MDLCGETGESWLFGALLVRAVRRSDGAPIQGLRIRVAGSIDEAAGGG